MLLEGRSNRWRLSLDTGRSLSPVPLSASSEMFYKQRFSAEYMVTIAAVVVRVVSARQFAVVDDVLVILNGTFQVALDVWDDPV